MSLIWKQSYTREEGLVIWYPETSDFCCPYSDKEKASYMANAEPGQVEQPQASGSCAHQTLAELCWQGSALGGAAMGVAPLYPGAMAAGRSLPLDQADPLTISPVLPP